MAGDLSTNGMVEAVAAVKANTRRTALDQVSICLSDLMERIVVILLGLKSLAKCHVICSAEDINLFAIARGLIVATLAKLFLFYDGGFSK